MSLWSLCSPCLRTFDERVCCDRSDQSAQSPLVALIDAFVAHGDLHEVRVPGLDLTVWFVPSVGDITTLMDEGISRGRIWTAAELGDFIMSTDARPPATGGGSARKRTCQHVTVGLLVTVGLAGVGWRVSADVTPNTSCR